MLNIFRMRHLFLALFLILSLTGRAEYVLFSHPEPETSLAKLKDVAGVDIGMTISIAGLVQYEIEIDVDSPFVADKKCLEAFLILVDATGAELGEIPLHAFSEQGTTDKKKKPFYRIHFCLKKELQKNSYLQIGDNLGIRMYYRKVWLSEPTVPTPAATKPTR